MKPAPSGYPSGRLPSLAYSGVSWATNAIPSRAAADPAAQPPSTATDPADGAASPTARFSSVVLPAACKADLPYGHASAGEHAAVSSELQPPIEQPVLQMGEFTG
jgi:hypothetical protein